MDTHSDQTANIIFLAQAIKALTERNFKGAAQLAEGVYAATSDWVPVGRGPEDWDRSVAGSILALTQDDADRANDLARIAFAFSPR